MRARPLRRGDIETQGKRRAGKQVFAVTLGDREKVVAEFIGDGDLLQNFAVSLLLRFPRIRKLSEQSNLHLSLTAMNV